MWCIKRKENMGYKLSELVEKFGGVVDGADVSVSNITPVENSQAGEITFVTPGKFKKELSQSLASAVILSAADAQNTSIPKIITDDPYLYYCKVSNLFNPHIRLAADIHPTAIIDKTTRIGENCAISANVVIGANTSIGRNCEIYPNVVIGNNVQIGENVILYPNVTLYAGVTLGNDCIIHSGTVLGADGFGYAPDKRKERHKIPQVGGVLIGNNVEIGANSTVDSGTFLPTTIADGVKIDNLVQVAHNVTIGAHSVIAAHVGIAGSTNIGKYCILAGHAGLADHINICDHAVIGAFTGIGKSLTKPDLYMGAYPFSNYKDYAKNAIHVRHLNEMNQRLKALEKQQGDENVHS